MKEDGNACRWDVLSLSLVLNFVPDPRERGTKIWPTQIPSTSDIFREDVTVGSFVSRCFTHAHRLLVRDGSCRSASASHRELATDDLVQLPLPCVQNSRYFTLEHFEGLMKCVGFERVKERWRVGGKMGYWLFRKVDPISLEEDAYGRKSVLRSGRTRNNFAILL